MAGLENPMARPIKEKEPRVVATCENCLDELKEDEVFKEFDGDYFCDDYCIIQYFDISNVEGSDLV